MGRDFEVLVDMSNVWSRGKVHGGWAKPHDVGGMDGSHHSATLRKLCKHGFVEQMRRRSNTSRPSYVYRITEKGWIEVHGPPTEGTHVRWPGSIG